MAACCSISRILYSILFGLLLINGVTYASSQTAEQIEEVELITAPKPGQEFVVLHTPVAGTSNADNDLKKYSISKKVSKSRGKSEFESNEKENGKRNTDILIKDAKDPRLLRIISEAGLLTPQDILPLTDTLSSQNQENHEEENMNVSVEPEGMTGFVNDALNVDSDEQKILERKQESISENESKTNKEEFSNESRENVNIKLDSSSGVQKHNNLINDQDNTGVPVQKQLSLKEKDNYRPKKATDEEVYQYNAKSDNKEDEGSFDFVDPTLSDRHLVPAASAQNSRINVKKGPNGQDYEYEYIYYYYEDDDSPAGNTVGGDALQKDQKVQQKSTSTLRPTTTISPKFVQITTEQEVRTKAPSHEHERNQLRQRGSTSEQGTRISQPYPEIPSTQYREPVSNEVYQFQPPNSRYPGRQFPVTSTEDPSIPIESLERVTQNTRFSQRGRAHNFDAVAKTEPTVTVTQNKDSPTTKNKVASGVPRQPGLDLVDNLSFQTYSSSNVPTSRQQPQPVLPTQRFAVDRIPDEPKSKSINTGPAIENSFTTSKLAPSKFTDVVKEATPEYVTETDFPVTYTRTISTSDTNSPSTVPLSTLSENSLTTIYGAGLTDKAAHDLYAIYQQARAEETDLQDTTLVTEDTSSESTHFIPPTTVYTTTTTTPAPTTTPPTTTTTTTTVPPPTLPPTGKGRYRGNSKNRFSHSTTSTTTESASESSTSEKTRKFQPNRKTNGDRVPTFGRRGQTSSTASYSTSGDTSNAPPAESTKPSFLPSTRGRYRTGSYRSETTSTEVVPTTGAHAKPNFADRYNSRRRKGSSTTVATDTVSETQEITKSDISTSEAPTSTIRSLRGRLNTNSPIRPLRPGARLNLPGRNRVQSTTSTEVSEIDTDASGSADVPVEQREPEVAAAGQPENENETTVPTVSSTTTPVPDTLTRLRNRQKLRITGDKSKETKQIQNQANAANLNQNRRALVSNLLPRKRNQQSTPAESLEKEEDKIEKSESEVKPVTEDVAEEAPKQSDDAAESSSSASESVPSTTESKLSSLVASRRRNLASRRPGSLTRPQKQEDNNNEN